MNITRNTQLYKITYKLNNNPHELIFRDLTAVEYNFISNIKNDALKVEMAGKLVIDNYNDKIPIGTILKVGKTVIDNVTEILNSQELFDITISNIKDDIKKDDFMMLIKNILMVIPGQSFTDLIKLNLKDLIELLCLCEEIVGKPILKSSKHKTTLKKAFSEEDQKSLQQKMNELTSFIK